MAEARGAQEACKYLVSGQALSYLLPSPAGRRPPPSTGPLKDLLTVIAMASVIAASSTYDPVHSSDDQCTEGAGRLMSGTIATLDSNMIMANNVNITIGPAAAAAAGPGDPLEDLDNQAPVDQRILANWLSSINSHQIHKDIFEKVMKGTGSWIFENAKCMDWLSRKTTTLWGAGMPGAGKTCLTSIMINHLINDKHAPVLYFYCQYKDQLSTADILAGMLKQAVEGSEQIARFVSKLQKSCLQTETKPSKSELLETLRGVIQKLSDAFLVIDALDELNDNVRSELVRDLVSLQQPLFMTSRILADLPKIKEPDFIIRARDKDLITFISFKLDGAPRLEPFIQEASARADMVDKIYNKCDGMFLLAALQVDALETGDIIDLESLQEAVSKLPATLNDRYEQTFARIRNQSVQRRNLACRAILLLTHATRSLSLMELLEALTVDIDTASVQKARRTTAGTLISVCFGLLGIEKKNGTVQLIHYTAEEFFEARKDLGHDDPHTMIANLSAIYLGQIKVADGVMGIPAQRLHASPYSGYPLFDYACRNLGHHTHQSCLNRNGQVPTQVNHLFRNCSRVPLPLVPMSSSFDLGQAIHFAARYSIVPLFDENINFLNDNSAQGCSPLFYACLGGHTSLAKQIISGLEPKDIIGSITKFGSSVLHAASRSGQLSLMRILLPMCGHEGNINARDGSGWTPLHRAIGGRHRDVVQLLLSFPNVDINAPASDGWTPLHLAAKNGHESTVRLFLSSPNVNINAPARGGWTPLHIAAQYGHESTVQLLLSSPHVNINVPASGGATPLHLAAQSGHGSTVRLFLSSPLNVNINAPASNGVTPLHLAAANGYERTVRLLLSFPNVNINAPGTGGWTSLHLAAMCGHESTVRLLLNSPGIEAHARTTGGSFEDKTPLNLAREGHHQNVVAVFEEMGFAAKVVEDVVDVEPMTQTSEQGTPLDLEGEEHRQHAVAVSDETGLAGEEVQVQNAEQTIQVSDQEQKPIQHRRGIRIPTQIHRLFQKVKRGTK